ncbi:hypothetical protein Bca4012_035639 [Brassica carinata]
MKTSLDVSAVAVQPESFREAVAYSQRLFKFMAWSAVFSKDPCPRKCPSNSTSDQIHIYHTLTSHPL